MKSKSRINRRQVLKLAGTGAVVAAGGSLVRSETAPAASLGANDRIRLGVIGCGGMGTRHLEALAVNPHCEVAAVCDCFTPRYENAVAVVKKFSGKAPDRLSGLPARARSAGYRRHLRTHARPLASA